MRMVMEACKRSLCLSGVSPSKWRGEEKSGRASSSSFPLLTRSLQPAARSVVLLLQVVLHLVGQRQLLDEVDAGVLADDEAAQVLE